MSLTPNILISESHRFVGLVNPAVQGALMHWKEIGFILPHGYKLFGPREMEDRLREQNDHFKLITSLPTSWPRKDSTHGSKDSSCVCKLHELIQKYVELVSRVKIPTVLFRSHLFTKDGSFFEGVYNPDR